MGAKLAAYVGRHLTSLRSWSQQSLIQNVAVKHVTTSFNSRMSLSCHNKYSTIPRFTVLVFVVASQPSLHFKV